ncbi:MAG: TonB-dependent receptor [Bacteroidales bacterium]|nr:TonB-dependent receptor [Bacteroidales bacterium]
MSFYNISKRRELLELIVLLGQKKIAMQQQRVFLSFLFSLMFSLTWAQQNALVEGYVRNTNGVAIELVNVAVKGHPGGTASDDKGYFKLEVPADTNLVIVFSHIEFLTREVKIKLSKGEVYKLKTTLENNVEMLNQVDVRNEDYRYANIVRLNPKVISSLPNSSGGIEALIKTLPGVVSNSELSSQYSVRGGNFDENLIYVNDIEIYRPQLIRAGEQEGLSFVNPDMVESINFSAGGFEAKYGDKMSSVLDVKYKSPKTKSATVSASLLGLTAQVEGTAFGRRLSYSAGFRYKTSKYVLNSLDTKGEYFPSYLDFQGLFTYQINERHEISLLTYVSQNKYQLIPESRQTSFGTLTQALGLNVYFEGQELDKYQSTLGALSYKYEYNDVVYKWIASAYLDYEQESYDILGQYYLNELEKDLGSESAGDSLNNIGVGSYLKHGRNQFEAMILSLKHVGQKSIASHDLNWGMEYKNENIYDKIRQWQVKDSAGYSLPFPDTVGYYPGFVPMFQNARSENLLSSNRYSAHLQDTYNFGGDSTSMYINAGLRAQYWDFNHQFFVSPRLTYAIKPNWQRDVLLRFSVGSYYQPPFFKEYRSEDGSLNTNIKAQESYHIVLASDYNFKIWNRPFKFVSELYYKYLNNLIPYTIDNVLIRYYPNELARGYTAGIDFRLFGEFVPGIDSWASMSFMKSEEDVICDNHGYIPRPTDRRFNASIYFQDYLPRNPNFKVHLTLFYGSGLPFGPPESPRYKQVARMPAYFRTDIGFTAVLKDEQSKTDKQSLFKHLKKVLLTVEIFNLMNRNNTVSYVWVSDIYNRQYAVPNYLTGIRFNVKLTIKI